MNVIKNILLIWTLLNLFGCSESGTLYTSNSQAVFIAGDLVTILFKENKTKYKTNLNPHSGSSSRAVWSKLSKSQYRFTTDDFSSGKLLEPISIDTIEEENGDIKPYKYLLTEQGVFHKTGVRSENRQFVLATDDHKFYDTKKEVALSDLGNNPIFQKFSNIIKSRYEKIYREHSKYGQVSTIFNVMNNGKYIVTFASDTSSYDFIDFKTINIFNVETFEITEYMINVPESKSDGFKIEDLEFLNNNWVVLISYFEKHALKMAIWHSEDNIQVLPFVFIESYDIWNVREKYFAKLVSHTTNDNKQDYKLNIFYYETSEPRTLRLSVMKNQYEK